ncbi:hypothetical protein [Shewanella xiamenensis]|uniref:hypothetical protein n=1 Tax=Shewanella xiamenensis TaxID=332186 RepID=UPI00313C46AC
MGTFYEDDDTQVTLHAAERYPTHKDALRAMTIAGLRIIQNSRQLDNRAMRTDVFKFLLSPRALSYWKEQGWLESRGRTETVRLTESGLSNCSGSMHNEVAANTSEALITEWELRLLEGDSVATQEATFELPLSRT